MYKTFGQEFYPHEALRALKLVDKIGIEPRAKLVEAVAAQLPQSSDATRRRLAIKFLQRYLALAQTAGRPGRKLDVNQPFVRLVARHRHVAAQIELLYLRLVATDTIVGALARELFYPVCVLGEAPIGWSSAEFAAGNGGRLFADDPLLTRTFILEHARRRWGFTNRATIDRGLRVLQGAGLIAQERMRELRGHPAAFHLSKHDVASVTFVYGLYEQFLPGMDSREARFGWDELESAPFVRTLLLSPRQVREHCEVARRHQLLAAGGGEFHLTFSSLDAVVDALLGKAL